MRYAVYLVLAGMLCLLQYSWLSRWPVVPDLPLALAAWGMVDGTRNGVLIRAWMVGMMADLFDPGSVCFHAVAYLLLALAYLPIRDLVFRTRMAGWAGWAAICSLLLALIDGAMTGFGDGTWLTVTLTALLTAGAATALGWLFGWLPSGIRPVGKEGA